MKFAISFTLALLSAAVGINAIALPATASTELAARDAPVAVGEATPISEDFETAVFEDDDEDDFALYDSISFDIEEAEEGTIEARALEARGPKAWALKKLMSMFTKSKLGKKVWNSLTPATRKKITKYVKDAKKKGKKNSKATKKWIQKEVKPAALKVIGAAIGTAAAKLIINDVLPWIVDVILLVFF